MKPALKILYRHWLNNINWRGWASSASDTFSLMLATLAGVWLDGLLSNDIATWMGVIALMTAYPTGAVAVIFWVRKRGRLGARVASKFTKPAIKIAGWFVALWAGALFGSAISPPLYHWWFAAIALGVNFVPVMLYTWYLKKVESGDWAKSDPPRSK